MSIKRKAFYSIIIILASGLLAVGLFAGLSIFLPGYIESHVLPDISRQAGVEITGKVRRISLHGADLSGFRLGEGKAPGLTIDSVRIAYTLPGLLAKRIEKIEVSGVTVHLAWRQGQLTIEGIQLPESKGGQNKDAAAFSLADIEGVLRLGELTVTHGVVLVEVDGRTVRVPFQLEARIPRDREKTIAADLELSPQGQRIGLKAQADLQQNNIFLSLNAKELSLRCLSDLFGAATVLTMGGTAGLNAEASLTMSPLSLNSLSVAVDLSDTDISYQNIHFEKSIGGGNAPGPLQIKVRRQGENNWHLKTSSLVFGFQELFLRAGDISAVLTAANDTFSSVGEIPLQISGPAGAGQGAAGGKDFIDLTAKFDASYGKDGVWGIKLWDSESAGHQKVSNLPFKEGEISYASPQFSISGKGQGGKGSFQFEAQATEISATTPGLKIAVPELSVLGNAKFPAADSSEEVAAIKVQVVGAEISAGQVRVNIPALSVNGKVKSAPERETSIEGLVKFVDASVEEAKSGVKVTGMQGVLPVQWPSFGKIEEGRISVRNISWKNTGLGTVQATLKQDGLGVLFKGAHDNTLLSGLKLDFEGSARFSARDGLFAETSFRVPQYKTPSAVSLGKLIPAAKGFTVVGTLQLNGDFRYEHERMSSTLQLALSDTDIAGKEKGAVAVSGLGLSLFFPDLLAFRSAPQQRLMFQKASFGDLATGEGAIEFLIESADSVLIEKSNINWCDGRVYTQAMRFSPAIKDYDLTLYCDRLSFARLLGQFGVGDAEGKGRVNGRIPVRIQDGNISFHDGFLYSTPGEGGVIHMPDTKNLTAGIPMDSPQFSQLDLASEALKDFVYEWAKLDLNTEGEDLLLHMQLDGKPQNPLPFQYRTDSGIFVRIGKDKQGSVFQGIRLDVNFRLPLNKILYYGSSIKKLFER